MQLDDAIQLQIKALASKFEAEADRVRVVIEKHRDRAAGTANEGEIAELVTHLDLVISELNKFFGGTLPDLRLFPSIANLFITLHLKVFCTLFDVLELDLYKDVECLKPYKARLEDLDTRLLELVPEHMLVGLG